MNIQATLAYECGYAYMNVDLDQIHIAFYRFPKCAGDDCALGHKFIPKHGVMVTIGMI